MYACTAVAVTARARRRRRRDGTHDFLASTSARCVGLRQALPDRIEVNPDDPVVSAAMVKARVAHLRFHGWREKDLGLVWLTRARHGVTR